MGEGRRTLIVGAGIMGTGIAQVVAAAGFDVTLVDLSQALLASSLERIRKRVERDVAMGRRHADEATALVARIRTSTDLVGSAMNASHVIEAIPEKLDLKKQLFARLDATCAEDVVFATNTSQFPVSELAASTERADRFIGMHWFNPAPVLDLIEVVRGLQTSDETLSFALGRATAYGKQSIVCQRDTAGFVTTRLIAVLILEAARIVEEGIASVDDVDIACTNAFGHRMGPLATADLTGLDTVLDVSESLREHFGERFLPPQSLRTLVNAGWYGRKTGRGYRDHNC